MVDLSPTDRHKKPIVWILRLHLPDQTDSCLVIIAHVARINGAGRLTLPLPQGQREKRLAVQNDSEEVPVDVVGRPIY